MLRFVVELDCTIAVVGYTSVVLDLLRVVVVSFAADRCYMEDTSDPCSS